jgi:hypothetical protein
MAITNTQIAATTSTMIFLASGEQAITTLFFCNTSDDTDSLLNIYLVPDGNAVSSATQIIKSLALPATETFIMDTEKLILNTGDTIWANASENLVITASVISVSVS